jgi:hypothetical protein
MKLRNIVEEWKLSLCSQSGLAVKGKGFMCADPNGRGDIYEMWMPSCEGCGCAANSTDSTLRRYLMLWNVSSQRFCRFLHFDHRGHHDEQQRESTQHFDSDHALQMYMAWSEYEQRNRGALPSNALQILPEQTTAKNDVWTELFDEFTTTISDSPELAESPDDINISNSDAMAAVKGVLKRHNCQIGDKAMFYETMHTYVNISNILTSSNFEEALLSYYSIEHETDLSDIFVALKDGNGAAYAQAIDRLRDLVAEANVNMTRLNISRLISPRDKSKSKNPPAKKARIGSAVAAPRNKSKSKEQVCREVCATLFLDPACTVFVPGICWTSVWSHWVQVSVEDDQMPLHHDAGDFTSLVDVFKYVFKTYDQKKPLFEDGMVEFKKAILEHAKRANSN